MNLPQVTPPPAVMPGAPAGQAPAPFIQAAAAINLDGSGCLACQMPAEPQLRDITDDRFPTWAKILGVMVGILGVVTIINVMAKR